MDAWSGKTVGTLGGLLTGQDDLGGFERRKAYGNVDFPSAIEEIFSQLTVLVGM